MNAQGITLVLLAMVVRTFAVPFVLPWDDALPGVETDFSAVNASIGMPTTLARQPVQEPIQAITHYSSCSSPAPRPQVS